jgi:hypothetical protein
MTGSPPPPPSPGPRTCAQKPNNCHGLRKIIYFFLFILLGIFSGIGILAPQMTRTTVVDSGFFLEGVLEGLAEPSQSVSHYQDKIGERPPRDLSHGVRIVGVGSELLG